MLKRAHRVYARRSVAIIGLMVVAALVPYLCRGPMLTLEAMPGMPPHHGAFSDAADTSGRTVTVIEHGADRCAPDNGCCSTPAKQKGRYSPEAPALCGPIDVLPASPAANSVAGSHSPEAGLRAFPPGISAPLVC